MDDYLVGRWLGHSDGSSSPGRSIASLARSVDPAMRIALGHGNFSLGKMMPNLSPLEPLLSSDPYKALCTSGSHDNVDDTAGIIFLGAAHQGSSVSIAGAVLAALTGFLGSDTTLLLSLKNHGAQLSNLADTFESRIAPNVRRERKIPITSFYETKKTYLLGLSLGVVVSRDSAKVHADARESHSIETDHSGLNKCGGPTDPLFTALTAAIRRLKTQSLLEQADTWVRDKHYTTDRLRIERLSGESLSMDQCYINLAIVEQSGQDAGHSKKGETAPSPISILPRQKVEAPDKTMQVELAHATTDSCPSRVAAANDVSPPKLAACRSNFFNVLSLHSSASLGPTVGTPTVSSSWTTAACPAPAAHSSAV